MKSLSTSEKQCLQKVREFLENGDRITIRLLQNALSYASPRSISVLLAALIEKGWIYRDERDELCLVPPLGDVSVSLRRIPLLGTIACGTPLFAEENVETEISISSTMTMPGKQYFFLRICGDSMNQKGIHHGDFALIESRNTAENGEIIVALIHDAATLKELQRRENTIFLIPHSDNPRHTPILLDITDETFLIQGVFVRSFPGNFFSHF